MGAGAEALASGLSCWTMAFEGCSVLALGFWRAGAVGARAMGSRSGAPPTYLFSATRKAWPGWARLGSGLALGLVAQLVRAHA